jgi:hypothetical protein
MSNQTLTVKGTLKTITEFYQLVVELDDPSVLDKLKQLYPAETHKHPWYSKDNHIRVKFKIQNWEKRDNRMRFFDSNVDQKVTVTAHVKEYNFVNKTGDNCVGICLPLSSFKV